MNVTYSPEIRRILFSRRRKAKAVAAVFALLVWLSFAAWVAL